VSVSTASPQPLEQGFAGFNVALMDTALRHTNPKLQAFVAKLHPGWLRYPAGARSDAFDWSNGRSRKTWVDRFEGSFLYAQILDGFLVLEAKGGETIDDAYALAKNAGAQGLIVCVNVFTDTPESAGRFAAYTKRHGIKALAWQLDTEPTFFPQFFKNGQE